MGTTNKLEAGYSNLSNLSGHYDAQVTATSELFVLNENSQDSSLSCNIELLENSSLDITIFDFNTNESTINDYHFIMQANSNLNVVIVSLNQNTTSSKIVCDLNAEGSNAEINVVSIADSGVNTTYNVVCNNNAPKTIGNIVQRAVALDGGSNIFEATGYIAKDCMGAKNFQESRVLLLDKAAKGDASPILLINHHDVEAGHAAGVSRVDDEELYYLMSRGIDKQAAGRLMTSAFVRPVIDKISDEEKLEAVVDKINKKVL